MTGKGACPLLKNEHKASPTKSLENIANFL